MTASAEHDDDVAATAASESTTAHPVATLAASILGSSLAFIDGSVINVALPTIGQSLGAGPAALAWTINAYLLPLGALILFGGAAGDHYGRRRVFLIGLVLFLAASVLCMFAPTQAWLLAGRGLQGIGAALLMPNSLALLGATFTGEERGRAIGTWAAIGAIAGAVGPVIGGWIVDHLGWRPIFLINVPIALGAMWLAVRYVHESRDRRPGSRLDWTGGVVATLALGIFIWGLTAAAEPSTPKWTIGLAIVGGLALMALFVRIERMRGDDALMPRALFGTSTFAGLSLLTFFLYAALGGLIVLLPYVLIRIGHYSGIEAGAAMLPIPLLIGVGSRMMGNIAARIGGRWLLSGGALIVTVGLALYARIDGAGIDYWRDILPPTLIVAIGMAISVAPLTTSVMGSVDADHVGAASGFNSALARIGGLIATALLGFVFAADTTGGILVSRVHVAAIIGAASCMLAALCAVALIRAPDPQ